MEDAAQRLRLRIARNRKLLEAGLDSSIALSYLAEIIATEAALRDAESDPPMPARRSARGD